jgi:hypothetical protein
MACILLAASVSGTLITRFGRWQRVLLVGSALNFAGFVPLSLATHDTPLVLFVAGLMVESLGFGTMVQTLILGAQNAAPYENIGAVTGLVSSVRLLGGALGLSIVGALVTARTATLVSSRLHLMGSTLSWNRGDLDFDRMPPALADVVHHAYADSVRVGMMACGIAGLIGLAAVAFIPETPLRTSVSTAAAAETSDDILQD